MMAPAPGHPGYRRRSVWIALAVLLVLALRVVFAWTLRVDSDEPQHLHVAWQWTQGLLPYRDFFDNHTPLFHLLYAPLLALFGERADIVPVMRLSMLPLYFGSLWLLWYMGRQLWSSRVGLAAAALAGLLPTWFALSIQFRTDNLWAMCWLAMMAVLVGGRLGWARGLLAGVLAGAALAVSLKSMLLLGTAAVAGVIVFVMLGLASREWRRWLPLRALAGFVIGLLLIPGALAGWFAAHDAWQPMMYALFQHNVVADIDRWGNPWVFLLGPLTLPPALWLAWRSRSADLERVDLERWAPRTFLVLAACGYLAALYGYWPLVSQQSLLPASPLVILGIVAGFTGLAARAPSRWKPLFGWLLPLVLVIELITLLNSNPPWKNAAKAYQDQLATVLRLTAPTDYVMDAKGESIFRHRPIYWVLESITQVRLQEGSIVDDIDMHLQQTATPVVVMNRLPTRARAFVDANYIDAVDNIRVAGQHWGHLDAGQTMHFSIAIAQPYVVVDAHGIAAGELDGAAWSGPRLLHAGEHVFRSAHAGTYALVWAPALERGIDVATLVDAAAP